MELNMWNFLALTKFTSKLDQCLVSFLLIKSIQLTNSILYTFVLIFVLDTNEMQFCMI